MELLSPLYSVCFVVSLYIQLLCEGLVLDYLNEHAPVGPLDRCTHKLTTIRFNKDNITYSAAGSQPWCRRSTVCLLRLLRHTLALCALNAVKRRSACWKRCRWPTFPIRVSCTEQRRRMKRAPYRIVTILCLTQATDWKAGFSWGLAADSRPPSPPSLFALYIRTTAATSTITRVAEGGGDLSSIRQSHNNLSALMHYWQSEIRRN